MTQGGGEPRDGGDAGSGLKLARKLSALSPRSARLLLWVAVEGRGVEEVAGLYGVRAEAMALSLLRALRELGGERPGGVDADPGEEREAATRLLEELGTTAAGQTVGGREGLAEARRLAELRALGPKVRAELEEFERLAAESPKAKWLERLRRGALLALIAAAAWLYLHGR
jgi:hypothetical protein